MIQYKTLIEIMMHKHEGGNLLVNSFKSKGEDKAGQIINNLMPADIVYLINQGMKINKTHHMIVNLNMIENSEYRLLRLETDAKKMNISERFPNYYSATLYMQEFKPESIRPNPNQKIPKALGDYFTRKKSDKGIRLKDVRINKFFQMGRDYILEIGGNSVELLNM